MRTIHQSQHTTNNAGFAPAPAEAHQEANMAKARVVDDELEHAVSALERTWLRDTPRH
jgi:hypothetical protein